MTVDPTDAQVRDILLTAKSVAVIGVSAKPDRASHQVAAYLIEQTHLDVYLINPAHPGDILGQPFIQIWQLCRLFPTLLMSSAKVKTCLEFSKKNFRQSLVTVLAKHGGCNLGSEMMKLRNLHTTAACKLSRTAVSKLTTCS